MHLTNPKARKLPERDRPEKPEASYLLALLVFFFGFALRGCGGALKMRRSASSNGIGDRSGFGVFARMVGV
jgi:hypothetical protein